MLKEISKGDSKINKLRRCLTYSLSIEDDNPTLMHLRNDCLPTRNHITRSYAFKEDNDDVVLTIEENLRLQLQLSAPQ